MAGSTGFSSSIHFRRQDPGMMSDVASDLVADQKDIQPMTCGNLVAEGTPPEFSLESPALAFQVHTRLKCARAGTIHLPHGKVRTPVFMPVGTKGTIKGLSSHQLYEESLSPEIILGNTYHLALQPGTELIADFGGLHKFMNWKNNLLTDSGGFQMVSLLKLAEITEEGVKFRSPIDGTEMMLTPEQSIFFQNQIGADICMQLDDVVSSVSDSTERFEEATARSVRWLDRCIAAHKRPSEQNLFGIIQGGLDVSLGGMRERCLEEMLKRNLPGYAIGGLAGGEDKSSFWRVVAHNAARLPPNKPRYLMGVGYPLDLVVCVAIGVDMFDCVYPTRTARFGQALIGAGTIRLKAREFSADTRPVDPECGCSTCARYTRAFLHVAFKEGNALAAQLLTIHNIAYMMHLMRSMREAIMVGPEAFEEYVRAFLRSNFPQGDIPSWVVDALKVAEIDIHDMLVASVSGPRGGAVEEQRSADRTKGAREQTEARDDAATNDDEEESPEDYSYRDEGKAGDYDERSVKRRRQNQCDSEG